MRLHFELCSNKEPVPFDYQYFLVGVFNKWLKNNEGHNNISLYSLSWLQQGHLENGAINFPKGAKWYVSVYDEMLVDKIIKSALVNPKVFCGMEVVKITQQHTPQFSDQYTFKVSSPILVHGKQIEGKVKHYIFSDKETDEILTNTLIHKMDKANLSEEDKKVKVAFERSYFGAKTKLVKIKGISHRASFCPVKIEGASKALQFAWDVGVGHLTGCGFGALL